MVWVIIGQRVQTERVRDGLAVERECTSCGEVATFYERRAVRTFRLYFLDVFDFDKQRVMACGACGALFATDDHGAPSAETAEGWRHALSSAAGSLTDAATKAGAALGPLLGRAGENAREIFEEAREGIAPLAKKAGVELGDAFRKLRIHGADVHALDDDGDLPESARESDPEKAAVLRRFEELEKRLKDGDD